MDLYLIFKTLHVIAAMAWLGGGLTMLVHTILSIREKGDAEALRGIKTLESLGKRWFIPASLLTVIFGAAMTVYAGLWGELWVILGLVGFATTFLTGLLVFEPAGKAANAAAARGDEAEALRKGNMILRIAKFDYTVMFLIVADMVLKPTAGDWVVLLSGLSIIVVAGAYFLLGFGARRDTATAA